MSLCSSLTSYAITHSQDLCTAQVGNTITLAATGIAAAGMASES